ncbi:MAG: hypothetical protein V3T53_11175 [Phycisphaerales bacterium]
MSKQAAPAAGSVALAGPENDIPSERKGACVDRRRRAGCVRPSVQSHITEIVTEARFKKGASGRRQRLPTAAQ